MKLRITEIFAKGCGGAKEPEFMIQYRTIFGNWKWADFISDGYFATYEEALKQARLDLLDRFYPAEILGRSWPVN
jgi:hypothetical protein